MKLDISYRNIFKSTALFGGVQVITMLLNIVRGKVVAMILGAAGMGVMSLYTMVVNLVQQVTGLGFNVSGVREIASASKGETVPTPEVGRKIRAMRRINLIAASVGMAFMVASAPLLSLLTFGDTSYRWGFMLLGALVFVNTLAIGENAVLQGMRRLRSVALCNVMSALLGVVVGLPLICFLNEDGIVPAMILSAMLYYLIIRYESGKVRLPAMPHMPWRECWREARMMLTLGISLTIGYALGSLANYAISGGIRYLGAIEHVGMYAAAITITSQYAAMVFNAIATDYLPRLSNVAFDRPKTFLLVNKQTDLVVLAVAPIVVLVIFLSPIIIRLLLTAEFLPTVRLVRLLALTTFIQACYFPLGYMPMARGDRRLYFWLECVFSNVKTPLFLLTGYLVCDNHLLGLGYASVLNALADIVLTLAIVKWRYALALSWRTLRLIAVQAALVFACFGLSLIPDLWLAYSLMSAVMLVTMAYSLYQLNRRINLIRYIRERIGRRMKRQQQPNP